MPRRNFEGLVGASRGVLAEGEQVVECGPCWAAQLRPRLPLLLLARRQLLMVLTDRRVLLFTRWRRGLRPRDLVIGKRYEAFTVLQLRRARPLLQLLVDMPPSRFVFEFRPRRRRLGQVLAHRLDPNLPAPEPVAASGPKPAPAASPAAPAPGPTPAPAGGADDAAFWATPNQGS
jgi:hypothetical protein